ncbi:MAG: hypothetical protein A2Y82_03435 [Candidatus Buchananbacteria bacterium RBG_13_36_9]|uniref:Uncharacterized protein n=1 Tax=Candidatus Buchananbacteria bacterium RBG_13_36_9 TaxID=1797530 RepID=A0A1G1XMK3_9BACT|nr:MAG: hypothetical protein A2Y82_03435 [Candidatus Buchananbacteria bacterium RBG_13_36_9]
MRVKIVDGFKIRNTFEIDFGVLGDNFNTPFIRPGEIWLDKAFLAEKKKILVEYHENRKLVKKFGYEKAKKMMRFKVAKGFKIDSIKIKLLKKQGLLKIYLVKGRKTRENLDPNFYFGGHYLVYKYVPKNEVWIDNTVIPEERKYILVHELYELGLMKKGKSYNNAHDYANAAEKEVRRKDGFKYVTD